MSGDDELDLRRGDWQVLDAFHDAESSLAFQGLKRRLGMHQEALSRALQRLENDNLVERTEDGYRLTQHGSEIIHLPPRGSTKATSLLETYLPSDVPLTDVISRLKYCWFSTLRWLGYSNNENEALLTWVTDDGNTQVRARFSNNHLSIEIDSENGQNSNIAIKSAHELAARIIREYQHVQNAGRAQAVRGAQSS
jgi:DNA-binding MarR family transcriptional regulator